MKYMKLTKAVAVGSMMAAGVAGTTVPVDAEATIFSKGSKGGSCTKSWWGGSKCSKTGSSSSTSSTSTTSSGGSTTSTTSGGSTTSSTSTTSTSGGSTTSSTTSSGGTPVPEPSSMVLFGIGAAGVVAGRKIARKKAKKNA